MLHAMQPSPTMTPPAYRFGERRSRHLRFRVHNNWIGSQERQEDELLQRVLQNLACAAQEDLCKKSVRCGSLKAKYEL